MILEPIENDACQVFVNSSATRHFLTVEVRRKRNNRPDEIMMRHVGPLAFVGSEDPPLHGMLIEKITQGAKGVRKYVGNAIGPKGEESFDLAIDMEGATFHKGNPPGLPDLVTGRARNLLEVDNLVGRPSIMLNDGIFHTAAKTSPQLTITLKHRTKPDLGLLPFAKLIGANIHLTADESVVLTWRNQGKLAGLELKKPEDGLSYEVYIINDPLFESSETISQLDPVTGQPLEPKHDEFAEYYKLLTVVPSDDQFRLRVDPPPPGAPPLERGSTDIPCMPVTKGH
jgi:hypothetical protein